MRILVIGASGTIGKAVVRALSAGNEIVPVSNKSTKITVDIQDLASIKAMYATVGKVDAVVSAAGNGAWKPLDQLSDADFEFSLHHKLMGQINVIRYGWASVADGGSFTLTSGILARSPMPSSSAVSLINAGLEGFGRAAALEAPRRIRVNVVSPPWVSETLAAMGMDPKGGLPAATVARAYVSAVTGRMTGQTIEP